MEEWTGQASRGNCRYQAKATTARGEGGQALVWAARRVGSGAIVAVKVAKGPTESQRLRGEQRELEWLHREHPGLKERVIELLDWGETVDGRFFLVMPWYEYDHKRWLQRSRNLADLQTPVELAERFELASLACEAVRALQSVGSGGRRGVVHRDIKPTNFLVSQPEGRLRVILSDFGGARREQLEENYSIDFGFQSTGYAPPDQSLPAPGMVPDRSWDVYALAVTVYECLVDRKPAGADKAANGYTERGLQLRTLAVRIANHQADDDEKAQFQEWLKTPRAELLDLPKIHPIDKDDETYLRKRVKAGLENQVEDPEGLGKEIVDDLLLILKGALQGDPSKRDQEARFLHTTCEHLTEKLRRKQSTPRERPPCPIRPVTTPRISVAQNQRPPRSPSPNGGGSPVCSTPFPSAQHLSDSIPHSSRLKASHPRNQRAPRSGFALFSHPKPLPRG